MELYEEEVEMFPEKDNVEGVEDAADSCDAVLFDAKGCIEEVNVQEFVMTGRTAHNTLMWELVSRFAEYPQSCGDTLLGRHELADGRE